MIIEEWEPMFAATTPSFETLDKVLREMFCTAKADVIKIIQSVRDDNNKKGYEGPFCSLQLDLTTKSNVEYIAASIQLIRFVVVCCSGCFVLNIWFGVPEDEKRIITLCIKS